MPADSLPFSVSSDVAMGQSCETKRRRKCGLRSLTKSCTISRYFSLSMIVSGFHSATQRALDGQGVVCRSLIANHKRLKSGAGIDRVETRRSAGRRSIRRPSELSAPRKRKFVASSSVDGQEIVDDKDHRLRVLTDALVITSTACQSQSLFAATCLVEIVIEIYRQGFTSKELEVSLAVRGFELGSNILSEHGRAVLVSWASLIMLTLWRSGVKPRGGEENTPTDAQQVLGLSQDSLGMLGYVDQTIKLAEEGMNLEKLKTMQAEDPRPSPSGRFMQQNTLLIILALEIATIQGLIQKGTPAEAPPPQTSTYSPTGFLHAAIIEPRRSRVESSTEEKVLVQGFEQDWGEVERVRALAVQLLLSFTGGVLGSEVCLIFFVDCVMGVYESGLAAREVLSQLDRHEFEQTGGLLPIFDDADGGKKGSTGQLFARWLSVVYMTLALLGAPRAGGSAVEGWAWAETVDEESGSIEAASISNLVANTLNRLQQESGDGDPEEMTLAGRLKDKPEVAEKLPAYREEALSKQGAGEFSTVAMEDTSLRDTSSSTVFFQQIITLVDLAWRKFNAKVG
ncbi:hypothetical protein BSKO_06480 [Bryopsis sp. KO-2023]|nr:hypothetical protein BSKO_06480 [Bryopsis sp. KO-2023]